MAIVFTDWIGESTSTIGTGDITLGGTLQGFSPMKSASAGEIYYTIVDGLNKETGIGTFDGNNVLARTTVIATLIDGVFTPSGSPLDLSGNAQVFGTVNSATMNKMFELIGDVSDKIDNIGKTSIGSLPPSGPVVDGTLWYCTTDGHTYIWYSDVDSGQWVDMAPQNEEQDNATNVFLHYALSNANASYRSATLYTLPVAEGFIQVTHNTLNNPILQAQFLRDESLWADVHVTGAQGILTVQGYTSGDCQLKVEILAWQSGSLGALLGQSDWVTIPSQSAPIYIPVALVNLDMLDVGDSYVIRLTSKMVSGTSATSTIQVDGDTASRFGIIFDSDLISINDGIRDGIVTSAPTENAVYDALKTKVGEEQLVQSGVLSPAASWSNVPMYSDPELGGVNGVINSQAKALAARTNLLNINTREALHRSYGDAGFNLRPIPESFKNGGTLTTASDVLLDETTGIAYTGPGPFPQNVLADTNPASGGFVARNDEILREQLSANTGAAMVGSNSGNGVQVDIDNLKGQTSFIENSAIFNAAAPSLPTLGIKKKALFKPTSISDCLIWVVSRKAHNKVGWVAVAIANDASPSDASNYGGASNYRPTYVVNGSAFNIAKTTFSSKTAGTVLSSLTASQVNTIWGYVPDGSEYTAVIGTPPVSWASRQCYDCAGVGDSITYQVNSDCTIRLGMTNGSSTAVKIQFSMDGTNFADYQTVSLRHPPSGMIAKRDVQIKLGLEQTYYVRVENTIAASCLVAGVNIGQLPESGNPDVDNAMFIQKLSVAGVPNQYQGGNGANEFAAKELSTGKFFGTYHGGHSDFLQRLRTDGASYQLETPSIPAILISGGVQLHSYSKLTVQSTIYQYTAETLFGDGAHITSYSLKLDAGIPVICERVYTHMCTTQRDFDWVHLPLTFNKTDDGDVNVGNCQFIQQFRAYDASHLNCYFSGANMKDNSSGGAYISFQPNYNKQYYGPVLNSSGTPLYAGQFVTAKEYF